MQPSSMASFDEDAEIDDNDLDQASKMEFFATGNDGKVIKLHERMASIPISIGGQQFQAALEEEIKDYTDDQVIALAPFEMTGRGIAGIEEMAKAMDDEKVLFGILQIQIGEGTFARYKNIFIHFQGEKVKPVQRAKLNKRLAAAKDIIGHTHAPLVVDNQAQFTVDYVFNELKRVFEGDKISYKGSGQQTDLNTLRVNYQARMEKAKVEAQEEHKRLVLEKLRLEKEAKQKALEEEERRLEELKAEAARKKKEMEEEKKRKAEEERRLRHEREEQERLERKRQKEEEEKKRQEELAKNPDAEIPANSKPSKKKKKKKKKGKKKKDDWSDDRPWTPQRVVAAIHADISPFNWGLFKPSQKEVIPIKWGHGNLNALRAELKDDQVQYGLMRLSFGAGRFRRNYIVYFLWTPDSMSYEYKKGKLRMKHVSYNGEMQKLLAPWTISLTVEHKEKVTISSWIMRVKRTVVVDGGDELFSEEAFKKALEEESQYIEDLKKKEQELAAKRQQEEEQRRVEQMQKETRQRIDKSLSKQTSTEFTRVQLKQVLDSPINAIDAAKTPTMDADGNYLINHEVDYSAVPDAKIGDSKDKKLNQVDENKEDEDEEEEDESSEEEPREPSPEPVIELTEEEMQQIEEERKRKEEEELAKRKENELRYRSVLQSKLVLESVELCKRTSEKLCWVLFAPKAT